MIPRPAVVCSFAGALALFAFSVSSAPAAILLADPFSYPDAELEETPGWYAGAPNIGEPTVAGAHLLVRGGTLLWDGLPATVNAILCHRVVPEGRSMPSLVFLGFVLKVESTPSRSPSATRGVVGNTFLAFTNESGRAQRGQLGVVFGGTEGSFRLSLGQSSNVTDEDVLPLELLAGENVRVVVAYDTQRQVATVWVNPSGRADEPPMRSTGAGGTVRLHSIGIRMHNRGTQDLGTLRISRLVVATSFAEALPAR